MSAIKKSLHQLFSLFGSLDDVEILDYSNKSDYEYLWGQRDRKPISHKYIVVVNLSHTSDKWLSAKTWSYYFTSKYQVGFTKVVLVNSKNKNDNYSRDRLDYNCRYEYTNVYQVTAADNILQMFHDSLYASQPKFDNIVSDWFRSEMNKVFTASLKHSISNEIAPVLLYKSLVQLKDSLEKIESERRVKINEQILILETKFDIHPEQEALLELWLWITGYQRSSERVSLQKFILEDVFDRWAHSHYLVIDDGAKRYKYEDILKCILKILCGENISLSSMEYSPEECELREIMNRYDAIFLDIRLTEKDMQESSIENSSGIRLVQLICNIDPYYPIVIFSSTHQVEAEYLLKAPNIINKFRKPGIVRLQKEYELSLINLFESINDCLVIQENRIILEKIRKLFELRKTVSKEHLRHLRLHLNIVFSPEELIKIYNRVFIGEDYKHGLMYPFDRYVNYHHGAGQNIKEKFLKSLQMKKVVVDDKDKGKKIYYLKPLINNEEVYLHDIEIDFTNRKFSDTDLTLIVMQQLRNIAAHFTGNLKNIRPFVIPTWSLLLNSMIAEITQIPLDNKKNIVQISFDKQLTKDKNGNLLHPFYKKFYSDQVGINKCINEVFTAACYYTRNRKIYEDVFRVVTKL